MDEVLELGRQHDVHENERQHEGPAEIAQRALEFAAAPENPRAVAGRHPEFGGCFANRVDAITECEAGSDVRAECGHPLAIQPIDASGVAAGLEMDHVVQSRQPRGG